MRIYAVADIHGKPERIAQIRRNVQRHAPDTLVVAGDIGRFLTPDETVFELSAIGLPVLVVRGNADRRRIEQLFASAPNILDLHLASHSVQGVRFTGISGTVPLPFRSRIALKEYALIERLSDLARNADVLVSHPPPYGFRDRVAGRIHAGCKALARLVKATDLQLVLCGHVHEEAGFQSTNGTLVVNCAMGRGGGGAIIDMHSGDLPTVQMI